MPVKETSSMYKSNPYTDIVAEAYLAYGDVIPALNAEDGRFLHLVIKGFDDFGRSMSLTAAHVCHFPGKGKMTLISIVDDGIDPKKNQFIQDFQNLFELAKVEGLLDIEWEFVSVEGDVRHFDDEVCVTIDCSNVDDYDVDVLADRFAEAKRVNFIYDQMQPEGKRHTDPESAWEELTEKHRLSSHFCALALRLRMRCFNLENRDPKDLSPETRHDIYDVEHRRWMTSALILGYAVDNKNMIPYDQLPEDEKDKDRDIVDNIHYVIQ